MKSSVLTCTRRRFLKGLAAVATPVFFTTPGLFAQELVRTPRQMEGPFYPDRLPLDTDNDLIIINSSITPAVGQITHLGGRILDARGNPVRNATVEIWQVDNNGAYLHSGSSNRANRDANFQGFGRFLTGSTGEYYFRTIKPVPYPGRPAGHIHYKVKKGGRELLTSQIFVAGAPGNARDGVFHDVRDPFERELIQTDFTPIKGSKIGELAAKFDIIIGRTPADPEDHQH